MKITLGEMKEFIEFLDQVDEFVPLAQILKPKIEKIAKAISDIIGSFRPLVADFSSFVREERMSSIRYYESQNMTREQAMLLTIQDKELIARLLSKTGYSNK